MKPYHGLCIGGPKDGTIIDCDAPRFEALERGPLKSWRDVISVDPCATQDLPKRTLYRHAVLFGQGFWVAEGILLAQVPELLVKHYRPRRDVDKPRRQGA